MMKKYLFMATAILLFVACSKEEPAPLPSLEKIELPTGLAGLYSGSIPCDDCKAKMVQLTLGEDSSAVAVQSIIKDSISKDTLTGTFGISEGKVLVSLAEGKVRWNFKVGESNTLAMLTGAGTVYEDGNGVKVEFFRIFTTPKLQKDSSKAEEK